MVFDCIDEMGVVVFGKILDSGVVDAERKCGLALGVVPEVGGVIHGLVAVRG